MLKSIIYLLICIIINSKWTILNNELFVNLYHNELNKRWTILNIEWVHYDIIYSKNHDHSLIIRVLNDSVEYYNLSGQVVLQIGYYVDNNFAIKDINPVSSPAELP